MILDEIGENPNCAPCDMHRFRHDGEPKPVRQVRLYDRLPEGELFWVIGWEPGPEGPATPARSVAVEDSGAGTVYLLFGGSWGLRFKPVHPEEPWDLDNPRQWGEPFLLIGDPADLIA